LSGNACDAGGSPAQRNFPINACGSFSITAAPNPTSDNVLVSASQPLGASATGADETKIFQIKISDQAGNIKKQYSYPAGVTSTNISLNNLTAGIYNIQAYNGIEWISRQIVKQ
jgi:Secretion system C-terminal sorting domain